MLIGDSLLKTTLFDFFILEISSKSDRFTVFVLALSWPKGTKLGFSSLVLLRWSTEPWQFDLFKKDVSKRHL